MFRLNIISVDFTTGKNYNIQPANNSHRHFNTYIYEAYLNVT